MHNIGEKLTGAQKAAYDTAQQQYYYGSQSMLTLGDRLAHFFSLKRGAGDKAAGAPESHVGASVASAAGSVKEAAGAAAASASELKEELLKATGMKPKTFGDRVEDTLEAIHLKSPSEVKAAARTIASQMEGLSVADKEARLKLADTLSGEAAARGWDSFLKGIGVREKSTVDKAAEAYNSALHEMKVLLGQEDRSIAEKINFAFTDASDAVNDATTHAFGWIKAAIPESLGGAPAAAPPEPSTLLEKTRKRWDETTARTLASLFRARDTTAGYTDLALKKTGLREEQKTRLEKARANVDHAMHNLLESLGWHTPSTWERMRTYAAPPVSPSAGSAWDRALKTLHIRDKTTYDKASETYSSAMHKLKVAVGAADPTANERLSMLLEDQRNRMNEVLQSAYESMPTMPASGAEVTQQMRMQYAAAQSRLNDALERVRHDTDASLKSLGLRDKNAAEKLRDGMNTAWHDFMVSSNADVHARCFFACAFGSVRVLFVALCGARAGDRARGPLCLCLGPHSLTLRFLVAHHHLLQVQVGVHEPSRFESVQYATGSKPGLGGMLDRTLKTLHIRDKSAYDKATDSYSTAVHKLKLAVGVEDPTASEKLNTLLEDQRNRMNEVLQSAYESMPTMPASGAEVTQQMRTQYAAAQSRLNDALERVRHDTDASLKSLGLRDKNAAEKLRDGMNTAWHDFRAQLGLEHPSPTLTDRLGAHLPHMPEAPSANVLSDAWDRTLKSLHLRDKSATEKAQEQYHTALHALKVALGREDRTATEKLQTAMDTARERVAEAARQAGHALPGGGDVAQLPEAVRDAYDTTSQTTITALLGVRNELDSLLKTTGIKHRGPLEQAKLDLDNAMHAVWVTMGYEEPSLYERLMARWHGAKVKLGVEEPSFAEKLKGSAHDAKVRVDAMGHQIYEGAEEAVLGKKHGGFFTRIMGGA